MRPLPEVGGLYRVHGWNERQPGPEHMLPEGASVRVKWLSHKDQTALVVGPVGGGPDADQWLHYGLLVPLSAWVGAQVGG